MNALNTLAALVFCCVSTLAATVTVSWDPPIDNATGWIVYEQAGTNWARLLSVSTTNAVVTNVGGGVHTFSVTATNSSGIESLRSSPASTPFIPNSPTNITLKLSAILQTSPNVVGSWRDVAMLDFPTVSTSETAFYRVKVRSQ